MSVIAIHRDLFSLSPYIYQMPEGETLADMAGRVSTLPAGWPRHDWDVICINGQVVPRGLWPMVRPKPRSRNGVAVEVTFHAPPMGGDNGGTGKLVATAVASIALIAVSGGIASGAILGGLTGATAAGGATTLSTALGALVSIGGSLALSLLAPSPTAPTQPEVKKASQPGTAGASGNVLEPNASLPRVVGTMKVFPPYITEPLVYYDGEDQVVEALAALAGPHAISDIRSGGAPVADMQGVEYETREGWPGLEPLNLLTRYGRTKQLQSELRGHTVSDDNQTVLESQTGDIEDATPQAKILSTRNGQDEFWIGINFPQGLYRQANPTDDLRVPVRIRIREKGTTPWINLPEIHFRTAHIGEKRATIKLVWREDSVNSTSAAQTGWVESRIVTPGQAITPTTAGWTANAYFDADTGGDHYATNSNLGTTDVINVILSRYVAEFNLQTATFPKGAYEVEIKRGYAFRDANYTSSSYTIAGSVRDPFWYEGSGTIYQTQNGISDKLFVVQTNSVWNDEPVKTGDLALIAIKARNVTLDALSVIASGYVKDWDGSAWETWTTTSNPAPHLRDVLAGTLNAEQVPQAMVDDAGLVTWRTAGWTCDAVMDGLSITDAAKILTGCGYAQLYHSDLWGAVRDYDRSAEDPVQIFTPHNSASFSFAKAFPKMPDGFRVTFADSENDYEPRQIIHPPGASKTEQAPLQGLVTETKVRDRLEYDIRNLKYRTTFYSWDAPADAIKCRRGSLVGVVNDVLSAQHGSGRVTDWDLDGSGNLSVVYLDQEPMVLSESTFASITDLSAVADVSLIGLRSGMVIRRSGGTVTTHAIDPASTGNAMTLVTPVAPAGLVEGDMVAIGPLDSEMRRLVVLAMKPRQNNRMDWTITALAEAPEIFA